MRVVGCDGLGGGQVGMDTRGGGENQRWFLVLRGRREVLKGCGSWAKVRVGPVEK